MHKFVFLTVMKRRNIEFTPSVKFIRKSDELFDVSFCANLFDCICAHLTSLKNACKINKKI